MICHLHRFPYGLKQSLHAWFGCFRMVIYQFRMIQIMLLIVCRSIILSKYLSITLHTWMTLLSYVW